MSLEERFITSLNSASKSLQTADHMIYITYPLIKDKKLLLKILSELHIAVTSAVNAILQYEYYYKRIEIYSDPRSNFQEFREKCAPRYKITPEQVKSILEIIKIAESHKKSPFEFIKNDKIVIMSDNMQTETLTLEKVKAFLVEVKDIIRKASIIIKR
ncbi:MAG: hypothetical protein ABIE22_02965 [archaeon]